MTFSLNSCCVTETPLTDVSCGATLNFYLVSNVNTGTNITTIRGSVFIDLTSHAENSSMTVCVDSALSLWTFNFMLS